MASTSFLLSACCYKNFFVKLHKIAKWHQTEQNVTYKAKYLTKGINSRFRFTVLQEEGSGSTYISRNSTRNIIQAKQLCTNQKSTEGKYILPAFVLEKEGGFFHPPILWETTQLLNSPHLILLKNNKIHVLCGFFEPSGVRWWVFFLKCW